MARFREDVDGCGCIRCQQVELDALRRSTPAVLLWSIRLPMRRPSIAALFVVAGLVPIGLLAMPGVGVVPAAGLGILGTVVGRGYVGVVGRAALGTDHLTWTDGLRTLGRRLPRFLGAAVLATTAIAAFVLFLTQGVAGPLRSSLRAVGASRVASDGVVLLGLVAGTTYLVTKLWFLPEACFAGGYGPVAAVGVSWRVASVRRTRALALLVGFLVLLGLGIFLDTHLSDPGSPLVLSVTYRDTTVVLRSFGASLAGGATVAFDLAVGMIYAGLFVHHYVVSVLEA